MSTRRGFFGSVLLASLIVATLAASGCSVSVTRRYSGESQLIQIPIRDGVPVPEGKTLSALHYEVTDDQEISLRRTLESMVGFLGASTTVIQEDTARAGEEPYVGIRVTRVDPDTPAARAGLMIDDVILEANGRPVSDPRRFRFVVRYHELERPLALHVLRSGQLVDLEVHLESTVASTEDYELLRPKKTEDPHCGMVLGDLTGDLQKYFMDGDQAAVMVLSVTGGSPAFYSKIRAGDILTYPGSNASFSAADMVRNFGEAAEAGHEVELYVHRGMAAAQGERLEPRRSLGREVSFSIPFIVKLEKRPARTKFGMILGSMLCGYDRTSYVDGPNHRETLGWGAILNLIKYSSTPERKRLRLLWLIKFSW